MRLRSVILENFRAYRHRTVIPIEPNLTAFIGRNDAGKSTIFDALAIFFEHPAAKLDPSDLCVYSEKNPLVRIGCEFDPPKTIIVDAQVTTELKSEHLLNQRGLLEIIKQFDLSKQRSRPTILLRCRQPHLDGKPLILLKKQELSMAINRHEDKIKDKLGALPNRNSNPDMRRALRETGLVQIPTDDEDIDISTTQELRWERLKSYLPLFALFRADRPSTDEDAEVQDPMKFAIQRILQDEDTQDLIEDFKNKVQKAAEDVANRTIKKLKEANPHIAQNLNPHFRAEPKRESIFKLTIKDNNGIPLNKRGSGVRRLVLLSFFRAEAERRREEESKKDCIYAIEEPETSQHPIFQKEIIRALQDLSDDDNTQVLITTHVPGLASYLRIDSIRFVRRGNHNQPEVITAHENEEILAEIADDLGILPNPECRVIVYVEGMTDVDHFEGIFQTISSAQPKVSNPLQHGAQLLPLGGSPNLIKFVTRKYGEKLRVPDLYILDGDAKDKAPENNQDRLHILHKK